MQAFAKRASKRSDELSSHDFAEFNLVVNFIGHTAREDMNNARKMKHVIPSEKRARIIDR